MRCSERSLLCEQCPSLATTRKTVVRGWGHSDARILFVVDAPNEYDDEKGKFLAGPVFRWLRTLLDLASTSLEEIMVTGLVRCRPFVLDDEGRPVPRAPTPTEIAACLPYLHEEIRDNDPLIVLLWGEGAFRTLTTDRRAHARAVDSYTLLRIPTGEGEETVPLDAVVLPSVLSLMRSDPSFVPNGAGRRCADRVREAALLVDLLRSSHNPLHEVRRRGTRATVYGA